MVPTPDLDTPVPARPGTPRPRTDLVAALDVGGSSIKAGLVAADGTIVRESRRPTGAEGGPEVVIDRIVTFAADLADSAPIRAVGIGVPGVVDSSAGIARYASNLGWHDAPLVQLIADRVHRPVTLGHDVRLGTLAEARVGAGATADSMYFVAIGTGIAGGMVSGRQVDNGASGQAGELGHLVVRPGGPVCGCGNRGCLESVASASRIGRAYVEATGIQASARDVGELARSGDPVAVRIWDDALDALADALAAVTVLQDPGMFVIGGGLSLAGPQLTEPLAALLDQRLAFRSAPPIVVTALGDRAGLAGAGLLAWDALVHP